MLGTCYREVADAVVLVPAGSIRSDNCAVTALLSRYSKLLNVFYWILVNGAS